MEKTPLIIGCDHGAYRLKQTLKAFLEGLAIAVTDVGTDDETSVDYPAIGAAVAAAVSQGRFARGILLCGSGIGMSMVANKFPRVRAALCNDLFCAIMSRRHNDANVLVLGGRVVGDALALEILRAWLETPFEGGRHGRRLAQFDCLETLNTFIQRKPVEP